MLHNYLKIAWRNLRKNQAYALINITGLALGMGCAMLVFALVRFHYQTDRHHRHYDRIYQFTSRFNTSADPFNIQGIPYRFGQAVRNDYPELETVAMLDEWYSPILSVPEGKKADKKIKDNSSRGAFVEPAYFRIFDYTWLAGGPEDLGQPGTVVMSAGMARKCFGTTDNVLNRIVKLDARVPARVVGVFADYRDDTDLAYSVMVSWGSLHDLTGIRPENEAFDNTNGSTHCFALFNDRFTLTDWNRQLPAFIRKYNAEKIKETSYPAMPFGKMHLLPEYGGVSQGLLLALTLIGMLLIGTACINFVNLATAQALSRAREIGVRKVLGSTKMQLFWQFIGETAFIVLVALALAISLFQYGQTMAHIYLHGPFRFTFYFSPSVTGWLALLVAFVIVLAGVYPALIVSGFRPVAALAGRLTTQQAGGFSLRRGLVVMQFAISQMLVIGLIVVANQLSYVQEKDLGFRKDAIVTVSLPNLPVQDLGKMNAFRNLATALPDVSQFSYSMGGPPQSGWTSQTTVRFDTRPEDEPYGTQQTWIDANYINLYELKLLAGRNLHPSDTLREVLVNETFMQRLGFRQPAEVIGKFLHKRVQDGRTMPLEIVGVLKDFNQHNLKERIGPMFLSTLAAGYHSANIQLRTANYSRALSQLKKAYDQVYSNSFFESAFVDDQLQETYREEQTMGKLINFFAGIALLIGCMGLYGLVLFMVVQRIKEVGVRKVLGAGTGSILWLFGKEFIQLIGIAFLLSTPVAWWVLRDWLQNFEYKIEISPAFFVLALLVTIVVASLTVGLQSIKAAMMNPVQSLRNE
ncbi:FtsX-like permease family protein [Dyadobacter sediminis]|uniref:FtsX-like permease family protein n=1 Tax=Dyadobacter sediminis TaxID=1493691 RepID=A0A5R9KJG7_9BACT|nr:FtsX-like permease family protein [Dyadobacter sediminis]TLU96368.1 FtsX-like permease family protein [Dyadobacter sediminis]GGB81655.1 ABC transporter permease [Dyadobacter sediminis]